jgi:type I restriction enzyme S subunit
MDSHLLRVQPNLDLVTREYFATALQADNIVGRQIASLSHGSIMAGLSSKIVKSFRVPLPPLEEQPLIVAVLQALDTTVHETKEIIAKLKAVKHGLLHDLLTRGIDANGELRPLQADAPHLYKASPLGWIPMPWEVRQLAELLAAVDPAMRSGPFGSALLKQELVEVGRNLSTNMRHRVG